MSIYMDNIQAPPCKVSQRFKIWFLLICMIYSNTYWRMKIWGKIANWDNVEDFILKTAATDLWCVMCACMYVANIYNTTIQITAYCSIYVTGTHHIGLKGYSVSANLHVQFLNRVCPPGREKSLWVVLPWMTSQSCQDYYKEKQYTFNTYCG